MQSNRLVNRLYTLKFRIYFFCTFKHCMITAVLVRSSRPEVFCKKVLPGPLTLKKRLWHRCFPVNFAKFRRTPFLQNTFRQHPLYAQSSETVKNIWSYLSVMKWTKLYTYCIVKNVNYCLKCITYNACSCPGKFYRSKRWKMLPRKVLRIAMLKILELF